MKLSELKDRLNSIENCTNNAYTFDVLISTSNNSVGYSSAIDISNIILGFDWDAGRIFIIPEKGLVLKDLNRDVVKSPLDFNKTFPCLADKTATKKKMDMC